MNSLIHLTRTSLLVRMMLGMTVMLMPLIVLGTGSFLASRSMTAALATVVHTGTYELRPVTDLQKLVLQAAMPPNDYIILGARSERALFDRLASETNARFRSLLASDLFAEQEERDLVVAANAEWQTARMIGFEILAIPRPAGSAAAGARMKVFDEHINKAAEHLNQLYDAVQREIGVQQAHAEEVRRSMTLFLLAVFAGAVVIAAAAGVVLSRSIIRPIRALQDGVFRFGQGDNSFRVVLERNDEFGQLATTLNTMAERLEFDSLTGVYNRQAFHRRLRNEIERSLRYGHQFTLLMVDLDHFKTVNDTCGHLCGDDVLRSVTVRLLKDLRNFDSLARYGGEEFTVIMPETAAVGARAVAERLRESVASQPVTTNRGSVLPITISIGMAAFPDDARSEDDLIAAADQALYAAKEQGRNRVVQFEPGLPAARQHRST